MAVPAKVRCPRGQGVVGGAAFDHWGRRVPDAIRGVADDGIRLGAYRRFVATGRPSGFGAEFDRIQRGELAASTEARLKELLQWGGSTSFLSPTALSVASDIGVHPIGQVVGLSAGVIRLGYTRTTKPGQGRRRIGEARWLERTGPLRSWTALRQRALDRLKKQAVLLRGNAVIGIRAEREVEHTAEGTHAMVHFAGTAARVDAWRGHASTPVLTLASAAELWVMLQAGIEPVGVAGGFASVETLLSRQSSRALSRSRRTPNLELEDLTEAVYETRRLALARLRADAKALSASGLLGVELRMDEPEPRRALGERFVLTAHVLASAVRRIKPARVGASPIVKLSERVRD